MIGRFLVVVLAATLLAACANTATVKTDFDPKAQFGSFRSYSWITSGSGSESVMPQSVVAGIDARLQAAGWQRVAEGDVHVAAHVTRVQGQTFNNFYSGIGHDLNWLGIGSGWPGYATMSVDNYEKGTLVVDMFDARTKRAVWRGSASGVLPDDPSRVNAAVQSALDRLFAGFPPGGTSSR
ncbi:DUF4136 domain-containing protein [Variovorax sp. J22P240]|uniref:DUF4136 domain-containing protein n=1 Tax=Variovorax sp. J22P240 TaxID=3053514 RepID=UPI002577A8BE|nr:DUF4136 domain-containing protein [Variovorax sp. J22P240]MDL9999282.1 DUF4136 domain-containing protein [Variovorax sp. J22P240]